MIVDSNGIKIQNIYYMLAYAFKILQSQSFEKIATEEFENTAELLSSILIKGISFQIKKGLNKEYVNTVEPLSTLRGKIELSHSIKEQTITQKQLICTYDEFDVNNKLNQIIKTTAYKLMKSEIKTIYKKELKKLMIYFKDVKLLNPYTIDWNIRYNKNNSSYEFLINICYLVIKGLLQKDDNGNMKLQKFLKDKDMNLLYQRFILEYYKKHYPQFKVFSPQINWLIESDNEFTDFLPKMQTDILISKRDGSATLVIDAKYYTNTMKSSQYSNKNKFDSNNLYQIFSYVKNVDISQYGEVSGMLLYAKTEHELTPDANYNMQGNIIKLRTLDLSKDFNVIQKRLDSFVVDF